MKFCTISKAALAKGGFTYILVYTQATALRDASEGSPCPATTWSCRQVMERSAKPQSQLPQHKSPLSCAAKLHNQVLDP